MRLGRGFSFSTRVHRFSLHFIDNSFLLKDCYKRNGLTCCFYYSMQAPVKFFSFLCNRFLFCRCVVLPSHILSQKLLKGDDDLPKERVGKIPQKCLLGLVDDEMHNGKPRQSGPFAPGKGDDLKSLLAGPCNIVQDNIGFAALRHGNHQGRRQINDDRS